MSKETSAAVAGRAGRLLGVDANMLRAWLDDDPEGLVEAVNAVAASALAQREEDPGPRDGVFKWWFGPSVTPDAFSGPFDSREAALAAARTEFPEGDFTVVEADNSVASCAIFDVDRIFEEVVEHNEECWGEDYPEERHTFEQGQALEASLAAVLQGWWAAHGPKTWSFGTQRNDEYCPPAGDGA